MTLAEVLGVGEKSKKRRIILNEENMKRLYETIARIISEREKVKVIVTIEKKENAQTR